MAPRMLRASITVLAVIALTTVFSLSIYAAPNVPFQTGTITVRGNVTVNGNAVQTGATVMSGNTITTGSDGNAVIDFGSAGRVELRDGTTATITFTGDSITIQTSCRTEIDVNSGTVQVTSPRTETLTAGQDGTYDGGVNATGTGGANVVVDCEPRKGGGGAWVGPGLIGVLALIGVGTAVAIGIAVGDEDSVDVVAPSPIR
ncbi:MAG TPA: hypothetical protein VKA70_05945 [Blastocatellia bacterium]|nr:hypothetical protein [Blastocatellia bacterium]